MRSVEYWQHRLSIAVREAQDADRVWRHAMAQRHPSDDAARPDVLWQHREHARLRADELQAMVDDARRRRERRRRRVDRLRQRMAFVGWSAGRGLERMK